MKRLSTLYLLLGYAFFYTPILILVAYSFNNSELSLEWHGFTWHWYGQLWEDTQLLQTAWHSLILGVSAASIATFIGGLSAFSLVHYRFKGRGFLFLLIFMLIILPDIILGAALLVIFSRMEVPLGFVSLLLAHVTFCIPFVVVIVMGRLTSYDQNIIEAATDLGASQWQLLQKVIIPLMLPALAAAWLLSFTLSLDDVLISYFVAGPGFQILPLAIFSMVKLGVNPEVNALTTIILLFTTTSVFLSFVFMKDGK